MKNSTVLIPIAFLFLFLVHSCGQERKKNRKLSSLQMQKIDYEMLNLTLDTIRSTEQNPMRKRDSLAKIYGWESKEVKDQEKICKRNHLVNEKKVRGVLDTYGWPVKDSIGESGNLTICNVLQHSENGIRIKYLPMMRNAVKEKRLHPRFLARAEDRIATERGDLQMYGGQMKFYPETKSFNVWPVYDPININKRRAEIGLGPIEEYLKNRFDFEWDLDEQIKRTKEFQVQKKSLKVQIND